MSSSYIYNFYCLKTIAKPLYRMISYPEGTHKLQFCNSDMSINGKLFKSNQLIITDIELQYKNQKFFERYLYSPFHINYDLSIFTENQFDNKVQIIRELRKIRNKQNKQNIEKMNTDLWTNLSGQNQTVINNLYDVLELNSTHFKFKGY
jgi:hypothetical protein